MKRVRLIGMAVLVLALLMSVPVMAQDEEAEATEAPAFQSFSLPIMLDGANFSETLTEVITMRAYGFNGTAGDTVTISMTQAEDSGLDPLLVLLGPAGQVIASDDDSGEVPLSALITDVELPISDGYFILATTFRYVDSTFEEMSDDETDDAEPFEASYELTLTGNTQPTDLESYEEDKMTFFRSELNYNEPFPNGFSSAEEPVYYFVMDGSAGDVLDIELTSDDFDTLLYLFNPEGSRIAVNDDDPEGGTLNSAIRGFELPVDGQYLLMATSYNYYEIVSLSEDESYEGGDFTISVTEAE